jgi:hypothetical protein
MSEKKLPGERILERLEARTRRRPRIGFVPEFYSRLGLDDPWSTGEAQPVADGLVFLSATPFYQMLGRLARARMRREKRTERFLGRRAGLTLRAATRRMPGEAPVAARPFADFGRQTLGDDAMRVVTPQPFGLPGTTAEGGVPTLGGSRIITVQAAWADTPYVAARVARPTALDRVGERLRGATAAARVDRALGEAQAPVTSRRALTRAVLVEEDGGV